MKTNTIKLSDLNQFAANEIAEGRLQKDPEIMVHTGWESDERLAARVTVETGEDGVTYLLISQAK